MKPLNDKLFCLIKFGSKENMQKLIDKGELRFSLSKEYNKLVADKERGDSYEGAKWIENVQLKKIEFEHPTIGKFTFKSVNGELSKLIQYNYFYLSYSIYALSTKTFINKDIHHIDEKHLQFGDSAIFIKEPYKFLNSITNLLKKDCIKYEVNFVEYQNYENEGKTIISPFNKKDEHSHQMEFRIIIRNLDNKAKFIKIGSIAEYSHLVSSLSMIESEWKANKK